MNRSLFLYLAPAAAGLFLALTSLPMRPAPELPADMPCEAGLPEALVPVRTAYREVDPNWPAYFGHLACLNLADNTPLFDEGWDTLPQIRFWRQIINLPMDTAIVSLARDRRPLAKVASADWNAWSPARQRQFKDSVRAAWGLGRAALYLTAGKQHYYQYEKALPEVSEAVQIFRAQGVDPWFAQAILLIESPGQMRYSPAGAAGPFQLMPEVAVRHGLAVTDSTDERADLRKSAGAAARMIAAVCIPETRDLLRSCRLRFSEDDLWFRLMVLHVYHAGAGNVGAALRQLRPRHGGMDLILRLWRTESEGFRNASQNYSQIALASQVELEALLAVLPVPRCEPMEGWLALTGAGGLLEPGP
ncbi:MAG: transglycosylase SLT domain-containing protein [Bacteroidia bacterium]|nr:transglycosylase SLT domain-containing protein [Bacteroidia bacterium]